MHSELKFNPRAGWLPLATCLALCLGALGCFIVAVANADSFGPVLTVGGVVVALILLATAFVGLFGLLAIAPNEARVLLLFGDYKGTVVDSGFYWVNPFYSKKRISLRIRNFETGSTNTPEKKDAAGQVVTAKSRTHGRPSKVNDRDGNPIEISAVVVWKVVNTRGSHVRSRRLRGLRCGAERSGAASHGDPASLRQRRP